MPPSAAPLATSNDLRGQNEYAYVLNEPNLEGVYEVKFLAKFSHFGVMLSQTCDKQRTIAFIYIDIIDDFSIIFYVNMYNGRHKSPDGHYIGMY